jgi:hypothetical protein
MNRLILFIFFIVAVIACNTQKDKNPNYLPKATGKTGDVIIIMDSLQWKGALGTAVRKIFRAEVPGLPQSEPMFNVIWAHPGKLRLLTQIRNLVYVFTLDQNSPGSRSLRQEFTPETITKISSDTSFFRYTKQDEYSLGQEVMYLFGDTGQNLIHHLEQDADNIIDYFNNVERQRLTNDLLGRKSAQGVAAFLRKEQGIEIRIPIGYKLADKQNDFVWMRQIESNRDKDVFITWKPYEIEYQLLPDSIVAWRDAVAKKYLFEDPDNPLSYLVTERENFPIKARQVNFNNHFAMQIRALWRTNNVTMGGPYLGYALVDETSGLLYYIEGFAYAPGKDKREIMRELEAILWTFRTSQDLGVTASKGSD